MIFFKFKILDELSSLPIIESLFSRAVELKFALVAELPSIPSNDLKPIPSTIHQIESGSVASRIVKIEVLQAAKKKREFIFDIKDRLKFLEIRKLDLKEDNTYVFCRSAKIHFHTDVISMLEKFEIVYLYVAFDAFDLKVESDLTAKILVLNPVEYGIVRDELEAVRLWNEKIAKINNTFTRLKYRIEESNKTLL